MEGCHLVLKGKRDGFPGSCSLYLILERNISGFYDVYYLGLVAWKRRRLSWSPFSLEMHIMSIFST
jgi:hypothetical protein